MISVPPTNSLPTYSCGIVGQSEYSLIPTSSLVVQSHYTVRTSNPASSHIPDLSSSSSSTLNAVNFCGSTPCSPSICMLALEKPHCGVSGVPFMKSTTGADPTAFSIALRVSVDMNDFCRMANRGDRRGLHRGRKACPATLKYG